MNIGGTLQACPQNSGLLVMEAAVFCHQDAVYLAGGNLDIKGL
ncbi:hypothetical protein [Leptolyngbya sp. BC1307]|nr:hypothetical protein [Leptolyngbya sp. BC1307]